MRKLIWVGKYYSEIADTNNLFVGAILVKKPKYATNIPVCALSNSDEKLNTNSIEFIEFAYHTIKSLVAQDKDYRFMFYSSMTARLLAQKAPKLLNYFIGLNLEPSKWLALKGYTRLWISDVTSVPPVSVATKEDCTFTALKSKWPNYNRFIIQKDTSTGGHGTYIVTQTNWEDVYNDLPDYCYYIASPHLNTKCTMNNHLCISDTEVLISQASTSSFNYKDNKQLFNGAEFKPSNKDLLKIITPELSYIGKKIQQTGYRGICGVDYVITMDNKFYFIEINTRFQGSSFVLNSYLKDKGFSLQQMHLDVSDGKSIKKYKKNFESNSINCVYDTKERPDISYLTKKVYEEPDISKYLYII